jgi:chromosome partitioning protein
LIKRVRKKKYFWKEEYMNAKIITIAQQKGGAGKTTIAAHLAVALSQRAKRVVIIDVDPQGSLSTWYQLRQERFGEDYTGLSFVAATGWRVNSELVKLKKDFDVIVIDSPPHTETEAKTVIRAADLVIIPMQPSPTDLWATQATINIAEKENKHCCVLLNRVAGNAKLSKEISKHITHKLSSTLGNRISFASSLLDGRCVTETEPSSTAAQEVKAMTKEILTLIDKMHSTRLPHTPERLMKKQRVELS